MQRKPTLWIVWTAWAAVTAAPGLLSARAHRSDAPSDGLPGLLTTADTHAIEQAASRQRRDTRRQLREWARAEGYSARQVEHVLTETMARTGHLVYRLPDGTVIRFPWYRIGFAENRLANTGKLTRAEARRAKQTSRGGFRIHKSVTRDEIYALALKMDLKLARSGHAFRGHAFRGAKGGIGAGVVVKVGSKYRCRLGDALDPTSPVVDRNRLIRLFAAAYARKGGRVGLGLDIIAGDMNVKAPQLQILAEAFGSGGVLSAGVSGKPVLHVGGRIDPAGGIGYRGVSTGDGVWISARLAAESIGLDLARATVVAQGWGEVGRAFGRSAVRDGARVIAVQELWLIDGKEQAALLHCPHGKGASAAQIAAWLADVDALLGVKDESGRRGPKIDLASYKDGAYVKHLRTGHAAAGVLTRESVPQYVPSKTHHATRKILVEGANLAASREGARLADRFADRLLVVPGDFANSGGATVSNYELMQNRQRRVIDDALARATLERELRSGWQLMQRQMQDRGIVSERLALQNLTNDAMFRRSLHLPGAPVFDLEQEFGRRRQPVAPRWHRAGLLEQLSEQLGRQRVTPRRRAAKHHRHWTPRRPARDPRLAPAAWRRPPAPHVQRHGDRATRRSTISIR